MKRFLNRREAGRELARQLLQYADHSDVIILALPRGGVPVAYQVALALKAPLDVLIVRKLGLPGREELAIGAIASGGIQILNQDIVHALDIDQSIINSVLQQELQELARREESYRGNRPAPEIKDHTVIIIDDGLATGASMRAAVMGVRTQSPARIVVAVPAAAPQAIDLLQTEVDEIVYVIAPDPFDGVGKWYEDFSQTTDEEVSSLLDNANRQLPSKAA
jgi:putative phosphoribosyl transferase